MARHKSGDKRTAILAAAAAILAEHGSGNAPAAEISRRAGVAEGTLFIYFKTKEDLINAVHQQIKLAAAEEVMADFPRKKKVRRRLRHLWDGYVRWGVSNPGHWKVLPVVEGLGTPPPASRLNGTVYAAEVAAIAGEAVEQGLVRRVLSTEFVVRAFDVLAAATITMILPNSAGTEETSAAGFKMFWAGVSRKDKRGGQE